MCFGPQGLSSSRRDTPIEDRRDEGAPAPERDAIAEAIQRRTRLRTRILAFSIAYGLVLITGAYLLTWKARQSQRELGEIVTGDLQAASEIERFVGLQNAWLKEWEDAGRDGRSRAELAAKYGQVDGLLDMERVTAVDGGRLARLVSRFAAEAQGAASAGDSNGTIARDSNEISRAAHEVARRLRASAERRLDELGERAGARMWTALGVTWVIAILTIALARLALVKIVEPVERLSRAATAIAREPRGNERVPISGDREIALLARDFNLMIDAIAARDAELERIASTDELTSMANFRTFQREIEKEIERSGRYGHSFGLLIFDLDHFKKYNDRYGHLAGNEALRQVALTIREGLRRSDLPARYGGEEFAAIVPEIGIDGLAAMAERIRAAVAAIPPIGERVPLTCSIGGAMFPEDGRDAESLFAAADRRLYEAKEQGRNRVVIGPAEGRGGLTRSRA